LPSTRYYAIVKPHNSQDVSKFADATPAPGVEAPVGAPAGTLELTGVSVPVKASTAAVYAPALGSARVPALQGAQV